MRIARRTPRVTMTFFTLIAQVLEALLDKLF